MLEHFHESREIGYIVNYLSSWFYLLRIWSIPSSYSNQTILKPSRGFFRGESLTKPTLQLFYTHGGVIESSEIVALSVIALSTRFGNI